MLNEQTTETSARTDGRTHSQTKLTCSNGHPLCATVTLLLTIENHDSVKVHDEAGDDDVSVFCDSEATCKAAIDPEIMRRAKALLASFPKSLPSTVEIQTCSGCGCTDYAACENGCWWVHSDWCSYCEEKKRQATPTTKPCAVCQSSPHESACPNSEQQR